MLARTHRRLVRAVRVHGLTGTLNALIARLAPPTDDACDFDARYGVDTNGIIDPSTLDVVAPRHDLTFANRYEPTHPDAFTDLIAALPFGPHGATFMDIGAGKGRVLLMASQFPFDRVIGVEFARELVAIAHRNLARFTGERQCRDMQIDCADATTYPLPIAPTVLFLNNSFTGPLMARFVRHVEDSLHAHPRPVLVCYRGGNDAEYWEQSPAFTRIPHAGGCVRYQSRA